MSIAFSALVAWVLISPGIVFRYLYKSGWRSSKPVYLGRPLEELAYAAMAAFLLHLSLLTVRHCLWFPLLEQTGWAWGNDRVNWRCLLMLLTGNYATTGIDEAALEIGRNKLEILRKV